MSYLSKLFGKPFRTPSRELPGKLGIDKINETHHKCGGPIEVSTLTHNAE
jgi:hypothetical protein